MKLGFEAPIAFVLGLLLAGCNCGGGIPLPEQFQDSTYVKAFVSGSAEDDLWWPVCDKSAFAVLHYDGEEWSQVARIEGEPCLGDTEMRANFVSGGPGIAWLSYYKLWRITSDGKTEDLSEAAGGQLSSIGSVGGDLFGLRYKESGFEVVRLSGNQVAEVLPGPQYQSLLACARDDLWSDGDSQHLLHFDGQTWIDLAGPRTSEIGLGFASNDRWAIGSGSGFWHWDGSAWSTVSASFPPLPDAGGFSPIAVGADGDGKPVVIGNYSKSSEDDSGGFTAQYVAYRKDGGGWAEAEVIASRAESACTGMGCGVMVFGRLLDGTFVFSQNEAGGESTLATFKP